MGVVDKCGGNAAEHGAADPGEPVRAHDDYRGIQLVRRSEQSEPRRPPFAHRERTGVNTRGSGELCALFRQVLARP